MAEIAESLTNLSASIAGDRRKRHELRVAIRAEVKHRQADIHAFLKGLGTSRARAAAEFRRQAAASNSQMRQAVFSMLTKLTTDRKAMAAKQREDAAAFMRTLSSGVSAALDRFDTEDTERARVVRVELGGFRMERRDAESGWSQKPKAKGASVPVVSVTKATVTPSVAAAPAHAAPVQASPAHVNEPHQGGRMSGQASGDRHGGNTK